MLNQLFQSIIDTDPTSVVICDLSHTIVYMNPAAIRNYDKRGGAELVGKSLLNCHNDHSAQMIQRVAEYFAQSPSHNRVHTFYNEKQNKDVYMVALRDTSGTLIGYYEKHEFRNRDMSPFYKFS